MYIFELIGVMSVTIVIIYISYRAITMFVKYIGKKQTTKRDRKFKDWYDAQVEESWNKFDKRK